MSTRYCSRESSVPKHIFPGGNGPSVSLTSRAASSFLGCGRLEEPLNRYPVTAVVHGHAHNGSAEGRTATGVPVYNVSLPLMRRILPDRRPFLVLELPAAPVGK
jgi:Icc-related predicted phosphoesterase